ncbi:MAG: hypothetical protein U1F36_23765 [Planctomycetota bacterium]
MTVATVGVGAVAKGHDIQQTYYVGIFDPMEQLPTALYRITVRGEASVVNSVKFASGWVDARLVDSLETKLEFDTKGGVSLGTEKGKAHLKTGRGLWLFGPEGFRPAPRDHRLVVVMGSDPSAFFQAVDDTLGELDLAKNWDRDDEIATSTIDLLKLVDTQQTEVTGLATTTGGGE